MIDFIIENDKNIKYFKNIFAKIDEEKNLPNLLISSYPGVNKKMYLNYFVRKFYEGVPLNQYVISINANDDGGIKLIREKIKNFAGNAINTSNFDKGIHFKLIIINNGDYLTQDAQSALRRIIEDYVKMTRFIILVQDKRSIIDPILSRCSYLYIPKPDSSLFPKLFEKYHPHIKKKDYADFSKVTNNNFNKIAKYSKLYKLYPDEFFKLIDKNAFKYEGAGQEFYVKREQQCSREFNQ